MTDSNNKNNAPRRRQRVRLRTGGDKSGLVRLVPMKEEQQPPALEQQEPPIQQLSFHVVDDSELIIDYSLWDYASFLALMLLAFVGYLLTPKGFKKAYCGANRKRYPRESKFFSQQQQQQQQHLAGQRRGMSHMKGHQSSSFQLQPTTTMNGTTSGRPPRNPNNNNIPNNSPYRNPVNISIPKINTKNKNKKNKIAKTKISTTSPDHNRSISSSIESSSSFYEEVSLNDNDDDDDDDDNHDDNNSEDDIGINYYYYGIGNNGNNPDVVDLTRNQQDRHGTAIDDDDAESRRRERLLREVQKARNEKNIRHYYGTTTTTTAPTGHPTTTTTTTMDASSSTATSSYYYDFPAVAAGNNKNNNNNNRNRQTTTAPASAAVPLSSLPAITTRRKDVGQHHEPPVSMIHTTTMKIPSATHPAIKQPPPSKILEETLHRLQNHGIRLLAHGIQSNRKRVWIRFVSETASLSWQTEAPRQLTNASGEMTSTVWVRGIVHNIAIPNIVYLDVGKKTSALLRTPNDNYTNGNGVPASTCFSLLTANGSLDLQANSKLERDALVCCLSLILDRAHPNAHDWRHLYEASPEPSQVNYVVNTKNTTNDTTTAPKTEKVPTAKAATTTAAKTRTAPPTSATTKPKTPIPTAKAKAEKPRPSVTNINVYHDRTTMDEPSALTEDI